MRMKRRLISFLLALCMVISILPVALATDNTQNPFTDVDEGTWYYKYVQGAYEQGLMVGTSATTFSPNTTLSRAMVAQILYNKEGKPQFSADAGFTDVPKNAWYYDAVQWAAKNRVAVGVGDNKFAPDADVTREQFATMLYNYAEKPEISGKLTSFPDKDSVSSWAKSAMFWVVSQSIVSGSKQSDGTLLLMPQSGATRAEAATMIYRYVQVLNQNIKKFTVTFDSNGGSQIESQTVLKGETVIQPNDPTKDGYTFIGWYSSNGYSPIYDFGQPVNSNITIYAKWYNDTDKADSDNDGLTDSLEKEFGTDPNSVDSDKDGISDYFELNWLNYNPLSTDTDGDGVSDDSDDSDDDSLTNLEEAQLGTNPANSDSDYDSVSDYEEARVYHTDPLKADTDGDGVSDGTEILIGSNPLVAETQFTTEETYGAISEVTPVVASATMVTDATGAGTLKIDDVTANDDILLSQSIAGYLGTAYNFTAEGSLISAKITFDYDTSFGTIGEDFQPRIYYLNEETGLLEELENQTVTDGKVSVTVEHFSTYILLNKVEFDKVWEAEIKPPGTSTDSQYTGVDIVFVIDSSGSMQSNDKNNIRLNAAKAFVDKMGENDRAAVVDFDSYATLYQEFTNDHSLLYTAIDKVNSSGGTNLSNGMNKAIGLFTSSSYTRTDAYKYIIFLTDGDGSYSTSYTTQAKDNGIVVYTIGLGAGVKTSTLTAIAEGTGGKYYFASTANDLPNIYTEISVETVDYTTDSNNDGISDYYTALLNDGTLPLSNGACDLVDVIEMYGEESDDWDGDGLKNGEEISICTTGNKVYVKMESHPLIVDSDGDGYSDLVEKNLGTPRMKYTSNGQSYLDGLESDNTYVYVDIANDNSLIANINAFFDWKKTDEAKEQIIGYFYDYASKDTIGKNQESIAKLEAREQYLKYAQSLANIAKTAKHICSIADDVSEMTEGISNTGDAKIFVDQLKNKTIKIKGASAQVRTSRKRILDAMNSNQLHNEDGLETLLSDTDSVLTTFEEFGDLFKEYDPATFSKDLTSLWATTTSGISAAVGTVKKLYDGYKYVKLDTGYKAISNGYKDFLGKKGVTSTSTCVSAALNVVDGGLEIWETCNTYGKIKANREAYTAYIDLLYCISENAKEEYDRVAARDIAEIIADESWNTYDKQLAAANGKTVVLTTLTIALDVCPYTKLAKSVLDIVKLTISVTGLSNNAQLFVNCRTVQAISDGCISVIDSHIVKDEFFFSYDLNEKDYIYAYITQLAQSRLVGEDYAKKRMLKGDLAAVFSRWVSKTGKDDIEDMFKSLAGSVYTRSSGLGLALSKSLPYYNDFN